MADPLKGIDVKALTDEYGLSKQSDYLKGLDINALTKEYGGTVIDKPSKSETKQEFWQGLNTDPSWSGLVKRIGIGAIRGAKDVLDTGAHGLASATSAVADRILPEEYAAKIRTSKDEALASDKTARDQYDKEYGDTTSASLGRLGGQIAATIPVMPTKLIQGVNAAAGALPTVSATGVKVAAPLINRLRASVGAGAIGGATLGASTSSVNDKSIGENVGEGLVSGAIGGPLVVGAAQVGKALGSKIVGKISQSRAELAKRADDLGISLKATQVSSSPLLKKYDQMSGMLPFSGAQGITDTQLGQFTRAISRTFGKDTNEITPSVVSNARKQIGQGMENIYKSSNVKADNQLALDLKRVFDDAATTHVETEMRPVINQITNVIRKINPNGEIDGETYHALTKYNGVLSKAQKSSNPNIRASANEIRSALEKALDRSLPADQKASLDHLRGQYKAAMTVKDLVDQSADGYVSPLKLMQKVIKSPGGKLRSGELGEIADIGRAFFPLPADSGTPLGEKILTGLGTVLHNPLSALSAGSGALASGAALVDISAGGVGLTINRLMRSGLNSKAVKNAIIRSGTGETEGLTNRLATKIVPYSSEFIRKDKEPLRLTVYPKY